MVLGKYFQDSSQEEADKLCNYIMENRDVRIQEYIKLKKKNFNHDNV